MVMKSRAGTIFRKQDGVSRKSKGTVFVNERQHKKHSRRVRADEEVNSADTIPLTMDSVSLKNSTTDDPPPEIEIADPSRTLEDIAVNTARTIYRIKTTFPFVLFKDEVIVDEEKVTVLIRNFYKSGYLRSIMLKDISNISIDTSLLFARLTLIDRNFVHDQLKVRYLKKHEALKMRRIIMGLAIANANKVDFSQYTFKQIREYTEEIGRARETEDASI